MNLKSPVLWVVAALVVWVLASPSESEERDVGERDTSSRSVTRGKPEPGPRRVEPTRDRGDRPARDRRHRDQPVQPPAPRTYVVTRVVDGDTVELGNGEHVRLVGIDTPEAGECGYEKAADALGSLVLGRQVVLTVSDEDRDGYGRLLRYVDVGDLDAGLSLLRRGLAIARYDSRDGYGFHPREPRYIAADRGTGPPTCPAPARPAPLAAVPAAGCAAGYSPCVRPGPPDLDCADVSGPITVTGTDPHRLDGDGDGIACE